MSRPPALDGSLTGWSGATAAVYKIDGLNLNGPAVVETRMLYDPDTLYIHWSINQTQTGWDYPLPDLLPTNRMFTHGRGSTTCSLYLQGNLSHAWQSKASPFGRRGDSRLVFGIFQGEEPKPEMAVLGMYPYWDPKFGPATPTTYAVAWHNVTLANVAELPATTVKRGFSISSDNTTVQMAAAIPRAQLNPWLPALNKGILTGGDFSCNILGFQKDWWTNYDLEASQIVWDEPTEAQLCPSSWGNFSFA